MKKELKVRAFSQDCRAATLPKIRARIGGGGGGVLRFPRLHACCFNRSSSLPPEALLQSEQPSWVDTPGLRNRGPAMGQTVCSSDDEAPWNFRQSPTIGRKLLGQKCHPTPERLKVLHLLTVFCHEGGTLPRANPGTCRSRSGDSILSLALEALGLPASPRGHRPGPFHIDRSCCRAREVRGLGDAFVLSCSPGLPQDLSRLTNPKSISTRGRRAGGLKALRCHA